MITEQRKGEIAFLLLMRKLRKEGVDIANYKEALGEIAMEIGVSPEEMSYFFRFIYEDFANEIINKPHSKKGTRRLLFKG